MSVTDSDSTGNRDSAKLSHARRIAHVVLILGLVLFVAIQFIPYGRAHSNPAVTAQIAWDSSRTEALVRGACFDCHSHETHWPWYSHVAPLSWLVEDDVVEAREELNFSVGNLDELEEASELVREGEMPLWFYRPLHAEARLTGDEKDELLAGLKATFAESLGGEYDEDDYDD